MSTAQGDWYDQHRNHELAPKEADTAEPMSAEERAHAVNLGNVWEARRQIEEQIRQAEQAAYERAAQVADNQRDHTISAVPERIAAIIRALAQQPEKVE